MKEPITFDSYNDSAQARHTKAWVNQHSTQKDKSKRHSVKETPEVTTKIKKAVLYDAP